MSLSKPKSRSDHAGHMVMSRSVSRARRVSSKETKRNAKPVSKSKPTQKSQSHSPHETLAWDIYIAWYSYRQSISIQRATREARSIRTPLGPLWYHLADAVMKVTTVCLDGIFRDPKPAPQSRT